MEKETNIDTIESLQYNIKASVPDLDTFNKMSDSEKVKVVSKTLGLIIDFNNHIENQQRPDNLR